MKPTKTKSNSCKNRDHAENKETKRGGIEQTMLFFCPHEKHHNRY